MSEGANEEVIRDVFVRRGILSNPKGKDRWAGQLEDIPGRRSQNDSWN